MKACTFGLIVAALAGVILLGCGRDATEPLSPPRDMPVPTANLDGSVTDPAGDGLDHPLVETDPDLVFANIACDGMDLDFEVLFDTGAFDPDSTLASFVLDTDQDPATGFPGVDSGNSDSLLMGVEFLASIQGGTTPQAEVLKFDSGTFSILVGFFPATVLSDGYRLSLPLSALDNDDGAINYKVVTYTEIVPNGYTGIADYMPDLGLDPGSTGPCGLEVLVDIKPGTEPNVLNPKSGGLIPVAILGTEDFDPTLIDVSTLALGPGGASPAHPMGGHLEDVNGDGILDLLSHYRMADTGLTFGDTEACVTGELLDGTPFEGCDTTVIIFPGLDAPVSG